jgi:hypothetical protein
MGCIFYTSVSTAAKSRYIFLTLDELLCIKNNGKNHLALKLRSWYVALGTLELLIIGAQK